MLACARARTHVCMGQPTALGAPSVRGLCPPQWPGRRPLSARPAHLLLDGTMLKSAKRWSERYFESTIGRATSLASSVSLPASSPVPASPSRGAAGAGIRGCCCCCWLCCWGRAFCCCAIAPFAAGQVGAGGARGGIAQDWSSTLKGWPATAPAPAARGATCKRHNQSWWQHAHANLTPRHCCTHSITHGSRARPLRRTSSARRQAPQHRRTPCCAASQPWLCECGWRCRRAGPRQQMAIWG